MNCFGPPAPSVSSRARCRCFKLHLTSRKLRTNGSSEFAAACVHPDNDPNLRKKTRIQGVVIRRKGVRKNPGRPWSDSSSRYEGGFFSSRLRCSSSSFFFSSGVFGRGGALRASGSPRGGGGSALRLSGGGGGG